MNMTKGESEVNKGVKSGSSWGKNTFPIEALPSGALPHHSLTVRFPKELGKTTA